MLMTPMISNAPLVTGDVKPIEEAKDSLEGINNEE